MIKLFWYGYFVLYLLHTSLWRIKLSYLRKRNPEKADEYAVKKVRQISRHVLYMSNTQVEVRGLENIPEGACVFVANHQAIFDAFLIYAYIEKPMGFIAKTEIQKIPFVRSWLGSTHTIFMDRSDPRDSVRAISAGVENLKNGYSMVIFPEGTRSLSSDIGEFKKGSMKLAIKAKAPIIPLTVDGTYNVLEVGNRVRGNKVTLIVHKPVYPENLSKEEQGELSQTIQHIIEEELIKIKG